VSALRKIRAKPIDDISDIVYANLALTALPHRDPRRSGECASWRQSRDELTFEFFTGYYANGTPVGIPFGSKARLILIHCLTAAIGSGSPIVSLGESSNRWIRQINGDAIGGRTYQQFSHQCLRLSTCAVRVTKGKPEREQGESLDERTWLMPTDVRFHEAIIKDPQILAPDPWYAGRRRMRSPAGTLNRSFYDNYGHSPIPIRRSVLGRIANNCTAIDLYIWLSGSLPTLHESTLIPWSTLTEMFGGGYGSQRHLRMALAQTLRRIEPLCPMVGIEQLQEGWRLAPRESWSNDCPQSIAGQTI
jgi:hypothetical protein